MKLKLLAIIIICLLGFNFSIAQRASGEADRTAKSLTPPEGKALVYIVRPSAVGFGIKFKINLDGKFIGSTKGGRYIYSVLEPGEHIFVTSPGKKEEYRIEVEAGKTYFIHQVPHLGVFGARSELRPIFSESEGHVILRRCKLSKEVSPSSQEYLLKGNLQFHQPFLSVLVFPDSIDFFKKGYIDGEFYYKDPLPFVGGFVTGLTIITLWPLIGTMVIVITPPKNLRNPNNPNNDLLLSNPQYYAGFQSGAKKIKSNKTWKGFATGVGTLALVVIIVIFGTASVV